MVVDEAKKELSLVERDAAIEEIAARLGVRAEKGRRFAELTSLKVGGAIDWVISPVTEEQAAAVVYELDEAGIAWRALGSGSNVLADDAAHHYVVVSLKELKGEALFDGERVSVSAGYSLPRLCIDAGRRGLAGIEGLGGIPGTVGGALWMNAGAYGHEIGNVTEIVRIARGGRVVVPDLQGQPSESDRGSIPVLPCVLLPVLPDLIVPLRQGILALGNAAGAVGIGLDAFPTGARERGRTAQ